MMLAGSGHKAEATPPIWWRVVGLGVQAEVDGMIEEEEEVR